MFTDKQSFVDAFKERFIALNGKTIEDGTEQEVYQTLATMVREHAMPKWIHTRDRQEEKHSKQVIYFSLEFLLGRFLYNNLLSLDVLELVRDGLQDLGYDFTDITELEPEPGLGNGGSGAWPPASSIRWLHSVYLGMETGFAIVMDSSNRKL